MRKVLFIFSVLTDADVEWIATAGQRVHVDPGTVLIPIGARVDSNYEATPIMIGGVLYDTAGSRRDAVAIDAATGETLWMLVSICCCSFSITAVCIGCTSGNPKNCRASSGVQSISMFTFMSAAP